MLTQTSVRRWTSWSAALALALSGLFAVSVTTAGAAAADVPSTPAPVSEPTASNVTADALPTAQIDGVVWSQAVVGDKVYAGGKFANARPAGAAAGTNQVARPNLLAYSLSTGVLDSSFAPVLNAQAKTVVASPDGSRVYVGGSFTTVNGSNRYRIAAFSTSTGALITSFAPAFDYTVNSIVATNTTVYVGGAFSKVGNTARPGLAAVSATNGALLAWAPTTDATVTSMVLTPSGSKLIVGGNFQTINGASAYGLGALDPTTGALLPWDAGNYVQDAGANAAIDSLSTDGTNIYGTGYVFGAGGNLEGTFAANPDSGTLKWVEDCHGDTYGAYGAGGVVYTVSHAHYCSPVGGFPQTDQDWSINQRRALAFTADAEGTLGHNAYGGYKDWAGTPGPSLYNWFPDLTAGTYTGQGQAAWNVTGKGDYVVLGGEFLKVNNTGQQGLVRFAKRPIAPGTQGPRVSGTSFVPSLVAVSSHSARVAWQTNYDRDNENLTYKVVRNNNTAAPVYTTAATSQFWNRPTIGFVDTGLTPGATYTYKIYASDANGNSVQGSNVSITMPTADPSRYVQDVLNDGATDYWRLGESSGTAAADLAGYDNLNEGSGVGHGASGALGSDTDTASTFDGTANGNAATSSAIPTPDTFTAEGWFKTTSTSGGKIIGFGNVATGTSGSYDRQVYMDNSGRITFGVFPGAVRTVSSSASYNDGQWHYFAASLSSDGISLAMDGLVVGRDASTTSGQSISGYWRVGGDNLSGWPNQPSSQNFNGAIDELAIYPTALTRAQVAGHYADSGRTSPIPPAPTDKYGKAVYADQPDLYWRLDDASGPTAADSSANLAPGVYSGGESFGAPSTVTGATGTGVTFNGSDGTLASQQAVSNPTVYSEEAWFKTTTTHGGKIIGFGDQQSGLSSNYDRHVYMENSGQLTYGVWTGQPNVITSPATYNDGRWHQVVATQGSSGMTLYVDGSAVGTNPQTQAQAYAGYWRVGGDNVWSGDSNFFAGTIDEVAVYYRALTAAQVQAHYAASSAVNQAPTAAFTQSCTNLTCSFDATSSSDADGTIASYAWSFGDGSTATGSGPSHTFAAAGTSTVSLTVLDNLGASGTTSQPVTVQAANQSPTAAFTKSCTGLDCSFDASGSADPDGTVVSYVWAFGDNKTSTGATPTHSFAGSGTYSVSLTVTDNRGGTGSSTQSVTVAAPNKAPSASFSASCSNLNCTFDGSASSDPDGTIASYAWNFGDGRTGTGANPSHTFAAGSYTVALTVTDNGGATDTVSRAVTVTAANAAPTAAFTPSCAGLACSFDGTASADSDGTISTFAWTFGDSGTAGGSTTSHAFATAGAYTVTLTVADNSGATNAVSHVVTVSAPAATTVASDSFARSKTGGWGSADVGGAWTVAGVAAANFSVGSGAGAMKMSAAATSPTAYLNSATSANTNSVVDFTFDKAPTGSAYVYAYLAARHVGTSQYRARVKILGTGVVQLSVTKVVSNTETVLITKTLTGVTFTPGQYLRLRLQVSGTSSTALAATVWAAGSAEPATAQVTYADTSSPIPSGGPGLLAYVSSNAADVPYVASFANLTVAQVTGP